MFSMNRPVIMLFPPHCPEIPQNEMNGPKFRKMLKSFRKEM